MISFSSETETITACRSVLSLISRWGKDELTKIELPPSTGSSETVRVDMVIGFKIFKGKIILWLQVSFLKTKKLKVSVMLRVKAIHYNVVLYLDSSTVLIFIYYYSLNNLESVFST